jgi:chlorobactene glucosyltransferase
MIYNIFFWVLVFALFYLIATTVILIRNRFELTAIKNECSETVNEPKISVCIPARNEENNIGILLQSLIHQEYNNYDIHVLDDQSTDQTAAIVQSYVKHNSSVNLHTGLEKPPDWMGKPWACHQLSEHTDGEYLLFLDADTIAESTLLSNIVAAFDRHEVQMVTVWPRQILLSFWEKTIIPLIYYALVTLLPSIYTFRDPRWLPKFLKPYFKTSFAAACGQCIAFERVSYQNIGGHQSVKNKVIEDVELAKQVKHCGYRMRMFHGIGAISCRMYKNEKEMLSGFRKNFFTGFNRSPLLFIGAAILHIAVFIIPFFTMIYSLISLNTTFFFLSTACISIILIHRLFLSIWFKWDPIFAFTHPIAVMWFQRLGIISLADHWSGKKSSWKGRNV